MASVIERLEGVADTVAAEIVARAKRMDEVIGERPFGTEKLPEREQLRRFTLIRDDPQAWSALAGEHGWNAAIEYGRRLERMRHRYGEE